MTPRTTRTTRAAHTTRRTKTPQQVFYLRMQRVEYNLLKAGDALRKHPAHWKQVQKQTTGTKTKTKTKTKKTDEQTQTQRLRALESQLDVLTREARNIRLQAGVLHQD